MIEEKMTVEQSELAVELGHKIAVLLASKTSDPVVLLTLIVGLIRGIEFTFVYDFKDKIIHLLNMED
jgi:hypothetical protein